MISVSLSNAWQQTRIFAVPWRGPWAQRATTRKRSRSVPILSRRLRADELPGKNLARRALCDRSSAEKRRRSERLDIGDLLHQAELAGAKRPVPDAVLLEDHELRERLRLMIVVGQRGRFLGREAAPIHLLDVADHGAWRELEAPDESTTAAIDRLKRIASAATLAYSELAQHLILAFIDIARAQIRGSLGRECR